MSRPLAELSSAFTKGLDVQFQKYYDRAIKKQNPRLPMLARLGIPSDGLTEKYHHWESLPRFARWRKGYGIPTQGFKGVQWEVENLEFGRRIPMHKNDVADDRTKSLALMDGVGKLAMDQPKHVERLVMQVLKAGVDVDGLDTIPTAPDGQALFATTDGANARFGVTNGNLLTASGTSVAATQNDYYTMLEQWLQMQDTAGRELFSEDDLDQGILIIYAATQHQRMVQSFVQKAGVTIVQNVAATENVAAAQTPNVILDEGRKLILWPTQFLTGTSWYGQLLVEEKAIFVQDRETVQVETLDLTNSDRAKDTGEVGFQAHFRVGVGVAPPFSLIKNN